MSIELRKHSRFFNWCNPNISVSIVAFFISVEVILEESTAFKVPPFWSSPFLFLLSLFISLDMALLIMVFRLCGLAFVAVK